jgi:Kef-type K+ transport system membrane component KefB
VPFFLGYYIFTIYGLQGLQSILVSTAHTATSVAITVSVLTELGKMQTKEAKIILGAAIVDDILAIAVLSVVVTMVQTGNMAPNIIDILFLILKILGIFVLSSNIYTTVIIMVAVTTLVTPVWLKRAYSKEPPDVNDNSQKVA